MNKQDLLFQPARTGDLSLVLLMVDENVNIQDNRGYIPFDYSLF
jgi:hypothetical protein